MVAMFLAQRVILETIKFSEVPSSLQKNVRDILIESGVEFLTQY